MRQPPSFALYRSDDLKRLTSANHYLGAQLSASLTDTGKSLGYDLNGNITALKRYGSSGLENDLTFSHTGNRMTALVDANATGNEAGTKSFTYDANGNMTADGRKGLELSWNLLNLADSAAMHGSSLTYAWLSDGTKVAAKADDGSGHGVVKRYLGSFVYTTSGGFSTDVPADVESAAWDEGRIFFDIPEAVPEEYIEDPFSYVFDKGREYHLYDFKHSNNDPSHVGKENALSDTNRGMPIGQNKSGTTVFASARDIGNIGAGIVAKNARTGLLVARLGFDGYQTIQKIKNGGKLRWSIEGKTTRSAQMYGLSRSGKIKRDIQRYEKSH